MLRKRSLNLAGHQTSLALEPEFWTVLERMARAENLALAALVLRIDRERDQSPLASARRVAALAFAEAATG